LIFEVPGASYEELGAHEIRMDTSTMTIEEVAQRIVDMLFRM
jgi:hypothetical protein